MDGSCPYGIRCTFVHDSDIQPREKMTGSADRLIVRRNSLGSHDDEASQSGSSSGDESLSGEFIGQTSYRHHQFQKIMMKHQQQSIETMYNNVFLNSKTTMWM